VDVPDLTLAGRAPARPHLPIPGARSLVDIAQHTDQPVRIEIGGRAYGFSELPIESLGRLQQWVKDHVPNPLEVVKPHLDGFSDADRAELLRQARLDAASWPPEVGTARGSQAILGGEAGQREALYEGLLVHQPGTTRREADRIYRELGRAIARSSARGMSQAVAERTISRIFAILFGMDDVDVEGAAVPKVGDAATGGTAATASASGSTGT
jgi:hypothetical protein